MFSGPKQVDSQHCWWKKSCTSWRAVYSIIYDRFHTSQVIGRSPEPTISLQSMCCSWTFVYFMSFDCKTWTKLPLVSYNLLGGPSTMLGRAESFSFCSGMLHMLISSTQHQMHQQTRERDICLKKQCIFFTQNLGDLRSFHEKQYHTWMVSSFINFSDCVTILTNQLIFWIPLPFRKLT